MIRTRVSRMVIGVLLVGASAACGGGDDSATDAGKASQTSSPSAAASDTSDATVGDASASGKSGKDACAALPRATIQKIVGADPGEGELERAAGSTVCTYDGEAKVTVEIDPGSGVAEARISIEAYGDTCEPIEDIGPEALFCTGGFKAQGLTGQIVWTDGESTYFIVYNFGEATPSKDITLDLANHLQA